MKTNIILFGVLILVMSSCSSQKYLPKHDSIDINQYGSYIYIEQDKSSSYSSGELIAIDSIELTLLNEETNKCEKIKLNEISYFTLRYAKPPHYEWSIPLFFIYPIMHGYYSMFTIPLHLITTISTTASGSRAYRYKNNTITYDYMRRFARFPQGIPPNIDLKSIK